MTKIGESLQNTVYSRSRKEGWLYILDPKKTFADQQRTSYFTDMDLKVKIVVGVQSLDS